MARPALLYTLSTHRRLPLLLSLLAVLMTLPALRVGWQVDDLYHRALLLGAGVIDGLSWSPGDLFLFLDGDQGRTRVLMDRGLVPWWTLENLRLAFWRPLAVATHRLDYFLWPHSAPLMHLHSLLWFGAVVWAAALLYRRVLGPTATAGLAAFLYAIDDAHGMPAGWIANRNALVGTFFGLLSIAAYHRWRKEGWRPGAVLTPLFLLMGLFASESALAAAAYLFAYALFMEEGPWRRRAAALLPAAATALMWLALYHRQGYGAWGSGYYLHPLAEPLHFAAAVVERLPILLMGQWAFPPSGIHLYLSPAGVKILWLSALLFLALLALILVPLLRRERSARFWATGMILSLLPVCATFPHDRLLFFAGLGAMALLAQAMVLLPGTLAGRSPVRRAAVYGFLLLMIFVHALAAPLLLPLNAWSSVTLEPLVNRPALELPGGEDLEGKDLVIVNPPLPFFAGYLPIVRALEGRPLARRLRILAPGSSEVHVDRIDERTVTIRPGKGFLSAPFDTLFRGDGHPMREGERVSLPGVEITVGELNSDGRPAAARFRFDRPLEDDGLRWVRWEEGSYVSFSPPPVGGSVSLPGEKMSLAGNE